MIGWYPGHMVKAQRQIEKYLPLIDFVVEIVDARAPISTMNRVFDQLVGSKKRFVLMNKTDMADDEKTLEFKNYYRSMGKEVMDCSFKNDRQWKAIIKFLSSRNSTQKTERGLVVGVPNVGKSTFINRWIGRRAANVADRVGVTRHLQWYKNRNSNMELLDSAGISMPHFERETHAFNMALIGSLRVEVIPHDDITRYLMNYLACNYCESLKKRYGVEGNDYVKSLDEIGRRFSKMNGDQVDYDLVYELILNDFRKGLLGKVTLDQLNDVG